MAAAITARSFLTWSVRTDPGIAALDTGWRRARGSIAIITAFAVLSTLPPLGFIHLSSPQRMPTTSAPVTSRSTGATPVVPPAATPAQPGHVRSSGGMAPSRKAGGAGASGVLPSAASEVIGIASTEDSANCHGVVISTLSQLGYTPSVLAETTSGAESAGAINKAVMGVCASGVASPQVAAQVLKAAGIEVIKIGAILNQGFSQTAEQAANILLAVGFSATEIATALLNAFGQTPQQAAALLKAL